uniref:Uncharacterized protein n=1 Tax=Chelydra serpentina TaxID=8475 RepID=A0A8C3S078_CHESE
GQTNPLASLCLSFPFVIGGDTTCQPHREQGKLGLKPGISDVWEGRCTPKQRIKTLLPCFWLMSAGRCGEWEPWLKCSLLYGMSGLVYFGPSL